MNLLNRLTVTRRLGALVVLAMLVMLALVTTLMLSERSLLMGERQASVRQTVETVHGIAVHFHALAKQGAMTEEQARQAALDAMRPLRYSGKEYFWVNDMQARMLMHPINPQLEGTRFSFQRLRGSCEGTDSNSSWV